MRTRRVGKSTRKSAVLLMLAQLGCGACDPWPEPSPPRVQYIAAFPDALDVLIDDPAKDVVVTLVAQAYDRYGRVVAYEALQFTLSSSMTDVLLKGVSAPKDTTQLTIVGTGSSVDRAFIVKVSHAATGLSIDVPVQVHYARVEPNGTAVATANSSWPMVGMVSGPTTAIWQHNLMKAFVRRAGFETFVAGGPLPPLGDAPSGTVLSSSYVLWRKVNPWTGAAGDVIVPATATRAVIPLIPVFAGSDLAASTTQFPIDLQGGADIIEHTLAGVTVSVEPLLASAAITWTDNCAMLGDLVYGLPAQQQPSTARLAVYMLKRSGSMGGDRALSCGPGTLGASGTGRERANAIFVPEGPVSSATIAHEIGHALTLSHVTRPSGFFDNDLMAETDDAISVLRDRFTVGQAFRAALDPNSWLVIAGVSRSAAIDCGAFPMECPLLNADASKRNPP